MFPNVVFALIAANPPWTSAGMESETPSKFVHWFPASKVGENQHTFWENLLANIVAAGAKR
jgi:hypothetical protein